MAIIFGTNSYRLKSVSPMEISAQFAAQSDLKIEYRQRYFHLFFIPFFPIGKVWSVRQGGKLYHASDELKLALQDVQPEKKHLLWAWSGPLLLIAGLLIYNVSNSMEERADRKRFEMNSSILSAFFQDKTRTEPLRNKLETMTSLIDSSLAKVKYNSKAIDTSLSKLLSLYLETTRTRQDSLTGFTKDNTYTHFDFLSQKTEFQIMDKEYQASLESGQWNGYSDTSSVFKEIRKLQDYKFLLILKEYGKVQPTMKHKSFQSGYSLSTASIISIESGKVLKEFKFLIGNSDSVSHFTSGYGSGRNIADELQSDIESNVRVEARNYVFGKNNYPY